MLVVEFTCPICKDAIRVSLRQQMAAMGLYLAHLLGEHWEAVEKMRADLGEVPPGAWKRIAATLPR